MTALFALAPGAMASGGRAAGGGAIAPAPATAPAPAPTTTVPSGGGSRRGINDPAVPAPAPAPAPAPVTPCATLSSVTAPVGYYLTYAALWNDFTILGCATGTQLVTVDITDTNVATGLVDYHVSSVYSLTGNQNASGVFDNDFAPFNTTYTVTVKLIDQQGNLLDSRSTTATTPPPR